MRSLHLSLFSAFLLVAACNCDDECIAEPCDEPGDVGTDVSGDTGRDAGDTGGDTASGDTGGDGSCERNADCPSGACAGGTCVTPRGSCTGDEECAGDSYCCGVGCVADGDDAFCVGYGEGPRGDVNTECSGAIAVGLFEPDIQCEWVAPPEGDPYPDHVQVLTTPLVADLGNRPMTDPDALTPGEILIITYNNTDGGGNAARGDDPNSFGVLRVLNGQTCEQLESIAFPEHPLIGAATPAIGDLDGDGTPEIVALTAQTGLVAFKWNAESESHEFFWVASGVGVTGQYRWDGLSIHDLDDDGNPEVISETEVYDGRTGVRVNTGQVIAGPRNSSTGAHSVIADVDGDGTPNLVVDDVYVWDTTTRRWELSHPGPGLAPQHHAVADFGTPAAGGFDATALDGIAELVTVTRGIVRVLTLAGDVVLEGTIPGGGQGGPPTVGDFDNDGFPEVASAGAVNYAVFDIDCMTAGAPGCEALGLRWSQASQDSSSNRTGSSIFDFEGDGQAEAVYADECFNRIYNGLTGDVLYSAFRTSCTWYENPVVADPDRDENTEILVGSNANCNIRCPLIDPIHPGTRCEDGDDCGSGTCDGGFCRCATDDECGDGNTCADPLPGTAGSGQVCRAIHPEGETQVGLRVLRDSLDRWVSSRSMWNQHSYSITNVNDDGTIPRTSEWLQNHTSDGLNNYRQNAQGERGTTDLPDITGRLNDDVCSMEGGATRLISTVCNRGGRAVGAALPATFYLGDPSEGRVLCTSFTPGPVPVGGCLEVSCELMEDIEDADIHVRVNDDGEGGATTVECESGNNGDQIRVERCSVII